MKKIRLTAILLVLALLLCVGCSAAPSGGKNDDGGKDAIPSESGDKEPDAKPDADGEKDAEPAKPDDEKEEEPAKPKDGTDKSASFSDIGEIEFTFSSGVGAWHTSLNLHEDGTFDGVYMDSDMGDMGDDYPHGTVYYSEFDGRFTEPEKVNDYTYKFRVEKIDYSTGTSEEIKDGIRYVYGEAYGINETEDMYLYLPGAPTSELPEGFLTWVRSSSAEDLTDTALPFYGLYNEAQEEGFSGFPRKNEAEKVSELLKSTEEKAAELEKKLQEDIPQLELNLTSQELYEAWDTTLNSIWRILENTMDEDAFAKLREEEKQWINDKESAAEEAAAEYEGGSIYSLIYNQKAAELTKERVYYLAGFLPVSE